MNLPIVVSLAKRALGLFLFLALAALSLESQEITATIGGLVTDAAGLSVASAAITAVDQDRGTSWKTSTNETDLRGPARQAAIASHKMRWDIPDAAPTDRLNRFLWGQVHAWSVPYPMTRSAVFAAYTMQENDRDK